MTFRLRATTTTVTFSPLPSLTTSLKTRVRTAMLKVAAGLLVTSSPGL